MVLSASVPIETFLTLATDAQPIYRNRSGQGQGGISILAVAEASTKRWRSKGAMPISAPMLVRCRLRTRRHLGFAPTSVSSIRV